MSTTTDTEGRLTVPSRMLDTVRGRNDEMGLAVEDLSESIEALSEASTESLEQASLASAATEQVAGASSTVSAAAEELEASMREVATTAANSLQVAAQAETRMGEVRGRVDALNDSAGQISSVVDTVARISSQTRMLALNATIEAARAGEAGRGFAVVAAEVKELAGQTSAATLQITERLGSLAADTQAVSEAVDAISEVFIRVEELQQTIAAAVEQQTAAIAELTRSASESASAAGELEQSVVASAAAARSAGEAVTRSRTWLQRVQVSIASQRSDVEQLTQSIPRDPIRAAIVAHAAWKTRLREALTAGRVPPETRMDEVRRDDACEFGRWLKSGEATAIDPARTAAVIPAHANFHRAAAGVLQEISMGRLDSAHDALVAQDGYAGVARGLTDQLIDWAGAMRH